MSVDLTVLVELTPALIMLLAVALILRLIWGVVDERASCREVYLEELERIRMEALIRARRSEVERELEHIERLVHLDEVAFSRQSTDRELVIVDAWNEDSEK